MTTTGSKYVNIESKRLVGTNDLKERFLEYLNGKIVENNAVINGGEYFVPDGITISADGNDKIKITKDVVGVLGVDGLGNTLDIDNTTKTGIQFENNNTTIYYVGLKHCLIPYEVQVNPRTGKPEYVSYEEQIGEQGVPNSVTDNGGTITFRVDNVTESGVSNAGRICLVWKIVIADGATTSSIAIESCTVFFSGGQNQITTTGTLGQSTVDTLNTSYGVAVLGPTIKRYTDLRPISGYAFIGTVTGVGVGSPPTSFNHTSQKVLSKTISEMIVGGYSKSLLPESSGTYDIGASILRWRTLYINNINANGNIEPASTNSYDLGSVSLGWRDLFIFRTAYLEQLSLEDGAGSGCVNNMVPTSDDAKDLGNATYQWRDLYLDGTAYFDVVEFSGFAAEGVNSDIKPVTGNSFDIGFGTYRWQDLYLIGTADLFTVKVSTVAGDGVTSDFNPTTNDTYDLGSSSYNWLDLYIGGSATIELLDLSVTAGSGFISNIVPDADNTRDIGSSSYQWANLFIDGTANIDNLSISIASGEGVITSLFPNADDLRDLGSTTYQWQDLFIDGTANIDILSLSTTNGEGVGSSIFPSVNDTYNIGSVSYYWNQLYSDNIYYKTNLTTFDDYDDLELIAGYKPTEEVMTKTKGGIERKIKKGDVNTLPWPILGDKDPQKGDHFINLGDATMFLLGAIKQMYQLHKAEVSNLKKEVTLLKSIAKGREITIL